MTIDGTMERFASDDVTDVDHYQWWTGSDTLTLRLPISTTDRLYHTARSFWDGNPLDDHREEMRIVALHSDSIMLKTDDGAEIVLLRDAVTR